MSLRPLGPTPSGCPRGRECLLILLGYNGAWKDSELNKQVDLSTAFNSYGQVSDVQTLRGELVV